MCQLVRIASLLGVVERERRAEFESAVYSVSHIRADRRPDFVGRELEAAEQYYLDACVERVEHRRFELAAGFGHRRQQYRFAQPRFVAGDEIAVGYDRVHRQSHVDRALDEPVVHEYPLGMTVTQSDFAVFVKRIYPCDKPRLVRIVVVCGQNVRRDLVRAAIGQSAERIVRAQEVESERLRDLELFVESRYCERQVYVVRRAVVAVEPRRVQPPRVVYVVAQIETFFGQLGDVRHESGKLESKPIVERRPRRVRRRDDILLVNLVDRTAVRGDVHTRRQVRAASLDARVADLSREILPEFGDIFPDLVRAVEIEALAVEQLAEPVPRFKREAEAVRQPDIVESELFLHCHKLSTKKLADVRTLRDSVRIRGIRAAVGVQSRRAVYPLLRAHDVALRYLGVALVFKRRICELGSGVEGLAHFNIEAGQLAPDAFHRRDYLFEVAVGHYGRIFYVVYREMVQRGLVRIALRIDFAVPVADADIAAPLEAVVKVAGEVEYLRAVARPEQYRAAGRPFEQRLPLLEQLARDSLEALRRLVDAKRL